MNDDILLIRRNGNRIEAVPLDGAMAWPAETQRQLDATCGDSGDTVTEDGTT